MPVTVWATLEIIRHEKSAINPAFTEYRLTVLKDVRIVGLSEAPIPWPVGQRLPKG